MLSLDQIRQEITKLDQELLTLLAKRKAIAIDVARSKQATTKPVRDVEREQALLVRLIKQGAELGLDATYITQIYHTILEDSVRSQQVFLQQQLNANRDNQLRLAYVADSEALHAAHSFYQQRKITLQSDAVPHFQACFERVEQGQVDAAILPIESSSAGSINQVYDLLQHTQLAITGEIVCQQSHSLYSNQDVDLTKVSKIYTTPEAYAEADQCLLAYQDKVHYVSATRKGLEALKLADAPVAILASDLHPELDKLHLIKANVNNQVDSLSRYIIIAKQAIKVASQVPAKTTLVLSTGQQAGALLNVLNVFKQHQLPMTKLESRPVKGQPWQEVFYIDLAANIDELAMTQALAEIQPLTHYFKVLGCYPSHEIAATQLPSQAYVALHNATNEQHSGSDAIIQHHPLEAISELPSSVFVKLQGSETIQLQQDCQRLKQTGANGIIFSLPSALNQQELNDLICAVKQSCQQLNLIFGMVVSSPSQVDWANKYAQFAVLPWYENQQVLEACLSKLTIATAIKPTDEQTTQAWHNQSQQLKDNGNQQLFAYINQVTITADLNCISELASQALFSLTLATKQDVNQVINSLKLGAHLELELPRNDQGELDIQRLSQTLAGLER